MLSYIEIYTFRLVAKFLLYLNLYEIRIQERFQFLKSVNYEESYVATLSRRRFLCRLSLVAVAGM